MYSLTVRREKLLVIVHNFQPTKRKQMPLQFFGFFVNIMKTLRRVARHQLEVTSAKFADSRNESIKIT